MFGKNEIVGEKYFNKAKDDQLFVTSKFLTLQGEGPYRGETAYFIRLAKCNLNCGFCDTFFDDGDWLTFEEINQHIEQDISKYYQNDVPEWMKCGDGVSSELPWATKRKCVLVITGGEPTLQKNLTAFLHIMKHQFEKTQIESNGIVFRELPDETTLVCSPKCSEKNGVSVQYLKPNKKVLERADCLKFVMNADLNSPYSSIPDWAHEFGKRKPIFISPMNIYNSIPQKSKQLRADKNHITMEERSTVDEVISFWTPGLLNMEENQKNHEYSAKYCVKHGFIFNVQIHLLASLA